MKPLVLYHASCADGFTAAWIATIALRDPELVAVQYGSKAPPVTDRDVYVLDFSYPRAELLRMAAEAASIVVLDHHKTAQAELADLDFCTFDMNRSGAMLTWKHFFPREPVPFLVDYVQDRDLWRWKLNDSRAINAYIRTHDFDICAWDCLQGELDDIGGHADAVRAGEALLRAQEQAVNASCSHAHDVTLDGLTFPIVNCTGAHVSEVAGQLAAEHPSGVGACWFAVGPTEIVWSLRGRGGDAPDVSAIAKAHGGGGHRNAAGFRVPITKHVELLTRS